MFFEEFNAIFHTVMQDNSLLQFADEPCSRRFYELTVLLLDASKSMNLTAIKDEHGIILRHFADSLTVARFLPENAVVADIGCGAGFPCLPLAICRPDLRITAIDSTEKRIRFVNETAKALNLANIRGISARAEDAGKQEYRERFDVALARAVAELPILAELCLPLVRQGGLFLAMKAARAGEELEKAHNAIRQLGGREEATHEFVLRDEEESYSRTIIAIKKVSPTPKELPRSFARILKSPL